MHTVISAIGSALGFIMELCYAVVRNYGLTIIVFTLISKIILMPVSVWVHRNGLKVVKMQPEINRLHIRHFGDKDAIAEGQAALYKREKYNPLASLVPLAIQILILMGIIEVIYHPMTYLLRLNPDCIDAYLAAGSRLFDFDPAANQAQLRLLRAISQGGGAQLCGQVDAAWQASYPALESFSTRFMGVDLTWIASEMGPIYLLIPMAAGLSALFLSLMQNKLNPLQHEQNVGTQWGTLIFSVGLSLYLGYFVPAGVALYWIASNLSAVLVQALLNRMIDPRKHVDYQALEESRRELEELKTLGANGDPQEERRLKRWEKADYKRFFSLANKHLVFYSESRGFSKYFLPVIREIFARSNVTVHYITSDPNDDIFELAKANEKLKAYYIGPRRLITLFMQMDADVVVMTMTDLENYHYKRSYVRKDIRYIYMFHYPLSTHMVVHTGAFDHYDEILCVGDFQIPEIRRSEELSGLPPKRLEVCGYCQLDSLYKAYEAMHVAPGARPRVLIAPSWQEDNILDSCIDPLLKSVLGCGWEVKVRPHPEYMKRYKPRMDMLMARWKGYAGDDLLFETDFTSNESIYASDVVITDWSGTATEFSFVTLRPCVFVNTPPKINNPDYVKLGIEPQELRMRREIGVQLEMDAVDQAAATIRSLLGDASGWTERIRALREEIIANFPNSAPVSARAILTAVMEQQKKQKQSAK